jgi:ATP-binding cassette subfamily C (CFTR/MRP) protein 1
LLDEAISNIDTPTDSLIQRVIRDEFSAYTILVVAYRLDTLLYSDRIAVLDSGRLVEYACLQILLSKDSAFSGLYNARDIKEL